METLHSTRRAWAVVGIWLMFGSPGWAVVDTLDATVTAQVEEYLGSQIINSDFAFENLDETTGNLPLMVEAGFLDSDDTEEVAGAMATTTFNDPRLSEKPDPDEFGIDVAAFSQSLLLSYSGWSNSTETRSIVFESGEIGEPNGTDLQVRSYFYVDGVLVIFSDDWVTDLSGTTSEVSLNVKQQRAGQEDFTTVLEASLTLTGQEDGSITVTTDGELEPANIVQIDLSELVTDLGMLHLVIIPDIAIPYLYPAEVGETFTLVAEIEGKVRNQPGTGASVQLGVPFLELAGLLNDITGIGTGDLVQDALQDALNSGSTAAKPLNASGSDMEVTVAGKPGLDIVGIPFCGHLGIESVLFMTAFGVLLVPFRRWFV